MDKNKATNDNALKLYAKLAKQFEDSGMNVSLFRVAARLGDKDLKEKALKRGPEVFGV